MQRALSLHEGIQQFAQSVARRPISDNTRKAFVGDVRIFERWLADSKPLASLNSEHVRLFLKQLEAGGSAQSPKSVERRLTSLKVFFDWATRTGILSVNPADSVAYKPFVDALPEYLTEPQAAAVLQAASALATGEKLEQRPLLAISLVLETAIKKGECLALTLDDVERSATSPAIHVRYEKRHLKYKDRRVAITPNTLKLIEEYAVRSAISSRLFECTGRNLEYLFNRKVAALAGLSSLTFEQLRWTSALRDFGTGNFTDEQLQQRYGLSAAAWAEMAEKLQRIRGG